MENKITVEIIANGWKTNVTVNEKTYTEKWAAEYGGAECDGDTLDENDEIPEVLRDRLYNLDCFQLQQALYKLENEEED